MSLDYKTILCQLVEDMGGEITMSKDVLKEHHVLHYFEDDDDIVIVAEIMEDKC